MKSEKKILKTKTWKSYYERLAYEMGIYSGYIIGAIDDKIKIK